MINSNHVHRHRHENKSKKSTIDDLSPRYASADEKSRIVRVEHYSARLSHPNCVGKRRKQAQGFVADRTQATVAPMQMASTRAASEHMAGTSRVQARWHTSTGEAIGTRDQ